MGVLCPVPGSALLYIGYLVSVCDPRAPDRAGEQPTAGRAYLLRPSWRIRFMLSSTPNAPASFPPGVDPGALVGEARGILRHCADPGPVVITWLAEEQRAAAARTRQEGLIEPLTDREVTILRLLPAPSSLRQIASELFIAPNTLKTHLRAIYRKLGAESREEAVIRGRESGLI
jgi:DNA-binding CsgD family transcriptional regulator